TVQVDYSVLEGPAVELELRLMLDIRNHDAAVAEDARRDYQIDIGSDLLTIGRSGAPRLYVKCAGATCGFERDEQTIPQILYRVEASRGYSAIGDMWSPGRLTGRVDRGRPLVVLASTEDPAAIDAPDRETCRKLDLNRREALIDIADANDDPLLAELVLA